MKARAFLFAVALLLRVSTAYPQAINLPVPNTSWVQIAGDDLFFANPNDQITTLRRWCDGTVRVIQPFELPKGGSVALLAMHGTETGDLYLSYARSTPNSAQYIAAIGRLDPELSSVKELWSSDILLPRSIAIGADGLIYAVGLSQSQEQRIDVLEGRATMEAKIFHIINPKTNSTRSLVPISLDSRAKLIFPAFLSRSTIVVRRGGTFLVCFDQLLARHAELNDLLLAREYNADGSILRVHSPSEAHSGASLASIARDIDDSLLLQYRSFTAQKTGNPMMSVIRFFESEIVRIPSQSNPAAFRALPKIPPEERLVGIRANGQLVTELAGKRLIRIWNR